MPFEDVRVPHFPASNVPATDAVAIVLDAAISPPARALWVGAAGNVAVTLISGNSYTFVGVPAGTMLPVVVKAVLTAGTTVASPTTNIGAVR